MILLDLGEVDIAYVVVGRSKKSLERKFMTGKGEPCSDLKFTMPSRITHHCLTSDASALQLGKCDLKPKSGIHPVTKKKHILQIGRAHV